MEQRNHTAAILGLGIALWLGLYNVLLLAAGLSSQATMVISGIAMWSVCIIIVSERIGCRWASLKDYNTLHGLGFCALLLPACEGIYTLIPTISEPNPLVFIGAGIFVAAVQGIIHRVQFSPEEREAIRKHQRRRLSESEKVHQ
ncbi:hypothetical protein [Methylobacterium trifolii]|uniref:SPW repeat-containing protein n=1 Tax=Methylobacterium trifolii TaxID=1003092 RepID=A0ABQ4U017_9HYPH|nr:hypothetical protein [Methylobacterium trifolii]GJE60796.1 hypothetical protein MPOCJGCO_2913 [Methylobacterium trifolii]